MNPIRLFDQFSVPSRSSKQGATAIYAHVRVGGVRLGGGDV